MKDRRIRKSTVPTETHASTSESSEPYSYLYCNLLYSKANISTGTGPALAPLEHPTTGSDHLLRMPSIHPLPLSIFAKSKYSPQDLSIAGNIVTHNPTSLRFFTRTVTGRDIPQMRGEAAGLRAMALTAPDLVPKIIGFEVDESKREAGMVTQYFDFGGGGGSSSGETQRDLARKIAKMHTEPKNNGGGSSRGLHDDEEGNTIDADDRDYKWTGKYGFGVPTHCGVTEQDNTWEESWEVFYRDRRLGDLVRRIGDKQISEEWERMKSRWVLRVDWRYL